MNDPLHFNPQTDQLIGPVGKLPVSATDQLAHRFLMLVEGECLEEPIINVARKYGFSRQRYYQLLEHYKQGGLRALEPQKTGPKTNYRRTDQVVRQVLRHCFLDPEASPAVLTQKLRQTRFPISLRSVQRILADYGLQKKTLRPQPPKPAPTRAGATRRQGGAAPARRRPQSGTRGPATAGRQDLR